MSTCDSFIKLSRNRRTLWLMGKYPWAYLLLNLIALRACRSLPNLDGLDIGEAHIGDWDAIGATRGEYRHALKVLEKECAIKIIENNRNRKKATTGTTTKGTKVKLLNSEVWDINPETNNHCNSHFTTTEQPLNNHEEEVKKKKNEKKGTPKPPFFPKIKFLEFVELTQTEHDSLLDKHGSEFLKLMLDVLNAYKGSTGKKYASDFHTMKEGGWVIDRVKKDLESQKGSYDIHRRSAEGRSFSDEPKFQSSRVIRGSNPVERDLRIVHE